MANAEMVLRFSNFVPPTHPISSQVIGKWASDVGVVTQGRVKVELIRPLGKPPGHFDLVKNGVADLALAVSGYKPSRFILAKGAEMPFLAKTSEASSIAYHRTHVKFFAKAGEFKGTHVMGLWTTAPIQLWTRKDKPIESLSSLKNLKIRVGSGLASQIGKSLGMAPIFAPAPRSYEILSKGVVDGTVMDMASVPGFRLTKLVGHGMTLPGGFYRAAMGIVMNQKKWESIDAKDRAAIDKISGEALSKLAGSVFDRLEARALSVLKKAGVTIRAADGETLATIKSRVAPIQDAWIKAAADKGVDGKAALAYFSAQVAKVKK